MGRESILLNRNYLCRANENPNQFLACFWSTDRDLSWTDIVFIILVETSHKQWLGIALDFWLVLDQPMGFRGKRSSDLRSSVHTIPGTMFSDLVVLAGTNHREMFFWPAQTAIGQTNRLTDRQTLIYFTRPSLQSREYLFSVFLCSSLRRFSSAF